MKIQSILGATIAVLILCSIALIGYNSYYWKYVAPTRTTISTAYVDNLKYVEDETYFMEVNYFSNALKNGAEVFEVRLNYYTDPEKVPEDEKVFKNVYSSGIQFIGKPAFKTIKRNEPGSWGFLKLGDNHSYALELTGDNHKYYNTTNGKSYEAIAKLGEVGINDKWIVDFDGTIALIEQRGFSTDNPRVGQNSFEHFYEYLDINSFIDALYKSVASLDNGLDVLQFDMSKWFKGYILDETGRKFETVSHGHQNWMFINVKVNKSSNGLLSASQSIFNMVNADSNYYFDGSTLSDYWKSKTVYTLVANDFDFISHNGSTTDYLARLKPAAINYLWSFNNLDINVIIDLDSKYLVDTNKKLVGFATNPYGILDIKQTTIKSKTLATFKVHEQLENAQLVNVIIELIGGGI